MFKLKRAYQKMHILRHLMDTAIKWIPAKYICLHGGRSFNQHPKSIFYLWKTLFYSFRSERDVYSYFIASSAQLNLVIFQLQFPKFLFSWVIDNFNINSEYFIFIAVLNSMLSFTPREKFYVRKLTQPNDDV